MKTRILTALVLLAAVLLWLFPAQYPVFTIGALFIYMTAAYELGPLLGFASRVPFVLLALLAMTACFYLYPPGLYPVLGVPEEIQWIICLALPFWVLLAPLVAIFPAGSGWLAHRVLGALAGLAMILPYGLALLYLRSLNYAEQEFDGAWLLLSIMLLVWACDSGAYFTGRALGHTPLLPRVSPNKTREGLYGGLVLALLCYALCDYAAVYAPLQAGRAVLAGAACAGIAAAVLGDLAESMLKRRAGLKDSGRLFPGHGGMLDRVDSQLAAVPVFTAVCLLGEGRLL